MAKSPQEESSSASESPVSKPLLKVLGLQEKKASPSTIAEIKPSRRESPRLKNVTVGKLSLAMKNKRVSWNLGNNKNDPIEISQSSEDATPVRGRSTLSKKMSPRRLSKSLSPPRSRKKENDSDSPSPCTSKKGKSRSKSCQGRLSTMSKSPKKEKQSTPPHKSKRHQDESTGDYVKGEAFSPKGATSNTDEDEALLRSTDVHPESRSIKDHLSDLQPKSPITSDTSDSGTDLRTRSSAGNRWTYEKIRLLCSIWEEEDHLYDPTHPQYLNKKLRIRAHSRMAAALNMDGKNMF